MLIAAWWIAGMSGAFLLWLDWKWNFPDECHRCPTRKGALVIACSGALGPMILGTGLLVQIASWCERSTFDSKWSSWWNKPVC